MKKTMFVILALTTTFSFSTKAFAQKEKVDVGKMESRSEIGLTGSITLD